MAEPQIRFDDGAAYERMMGVWSRLAGEVFLDWLAPRPGLRWIDVGCGNGAFTELIVERHAPAEVQGIDPSEGQLAYARTRPTTRIAQFRQGDAMALPFPSHTFDVAVMALVIFFVPDPRKGVAEMVRVAAPGGCARRRTAASTGTSTRSINPKSLRSANERGPRSSSPGERWSAAAFSPSATAIRSIGLSSRRASVWPYRCQYHRSPPERSTRRWTYRSLTCIDCLQELLSRNTG